ncbi:MAG: DoxX family protein [Bacteroidota bacterium]|jgi:putative oxidoreductase
MKKLVSIKYTPAVFNISFLLLRLIFGITMIVNNGYPKLVGFAEKKEKFVDFLGLGSTTTLILVIFAEVFCSSLIVLGLFTRIVCVPIVFSLGYAFFITHGGDFFGDGEFAVLYLTVFSIILLCGPGKISVDGLIQK